MTRIGNERMDFANELLREFRESQSLKQPDQVSNNQSVDKIGKSFIDHLKDGVSEVNSYHRNADTMATNLASGKSENLHETMLAATQAELSFNLMVQLRNKVLEAYQEVMRMPV